VRIYGARTVSSDPSWRYLNVRRLLSMLEKSVEVAMQWAVFEANTFELRELLRLGITGLLESVWRRGALVGERPEDAFFVKCDVANNPPGLADLGRLVVDVGIAPAVPAEFVVFRVGRTLDELHVTEIGARLTSMGVAGVA
jgi:phage tail sheath protein FI